MKNCYQTGVKKIKSGNCREAVDIFFSDGPDWRQIKISTSTSFTRKESFAYIKLKEYDAAISDIILSMKIKNSDHKLYINHAGMNSKKKEV